jgi:hypothetical protein
VIHSTGLRNYKLTHHNIERSLACTALIQLFAGVDNKGKALVALDRQFILLLSAAVFTGALRLTGAPCKGTKKMPDGLPNWLHCVALKSNVTNSK